MAMRKSGNGDGGDARERRGWGAWSGIGASAMTLAAAGGHAVADYRRD